MKQSIERVVKERNRQISEEGWSAGRDRSHNTNGELAQAAAGYAMAEFNRDRNHDWEPSWWPWASRWWKPTPDNRMRELEKAGALILAEMDRLSPPGEEITSSDVDFNPGMIYKSHATGIVVLCTGDSPLGDAFFSGVVIENFKDHENRPVGLYTNKWGKYSFTLYKGTIIL